MEQKLGKGPKKELKQVLEELEEKERKYEEKKLSEREFQELCRREKVDEENGERIQGLGTAQPFNFKADKKSSIL